MVDQSQSKSPLFVGSRDLPTVQEKHFRYITIGSSYLKEVFPKPEPERRKERENISDWIIRAKEPPPLKKQTIIRVN